MGPPLIAAEDARAARQIPMKDRLLLQWGRRSSRRKTPHRRSNLRRRLASMGPPLIAAEDRSRHVAPHPRRHRFNGAAAHRGGRLPTSWTYSGNSALLQWGRRSSRRKTRRRRGNGGRVAGPASMGPPLIAAEDARWPVAAIAQSAALQWGRRSSRRKTSTYPGSSRSSGRRFNGAAAHRGGRRGRRRMTRAAKRELQWGRRSSRRKTRVDACILHGSRSGFNGAAAHRGGRPAAAVVYRIALQASMGPPLIAAEDKRTRRGTRTS